MKKGFTLLELLVVIAIIGILASVVMVSLQNTKNKADVAYVKSAADEVKKGLEMYYQQNGRYGTYTSAGNSISTFKNPAAPGYGVNFPGGAGDCNMPFSRQDGSNGPGTTSYQIGLVVGSAMLRTNKVSNENIFWCGISQDGQSYAIAFEGLKSGLPTMCVDSSGNVKYSSLTWSTNYGGGGYTTSVFDPITSVLDINNPVTCR